MRSPASDSMNCSASSSSASTPPITSARRAARSRTRFVRVSARTQVEGEPSSMGSQSGSQRRQHRAAPGHRQRSTSLSMAHRAPSGVVQRPCGSALQARGHWFETSCAHTSSQFSGRVWTFRPLICGTNKSQLKNFRPSQAIAGGSVVRWFGALSPSTALRVVGY
jgi:hypothetical protein